MVRSVRIRGVAFGIAMLMVSHPFREACTPAFSQDVSQDAKAALKERDRFAAETQKIQATGKLVEAIASAEAMLAIERKVLPAVHIDIIRPVELAG